MPAEGDEECRFFDEPNSQALDNHDQRNHESFGTHRSATGICTICECKPQRHHRQSEQREADDLIAVISEALRIVERGRQDMDQRQQRQRDGKHEAGCKQHQQCEEDCTINGKNTRIREPGQIHPVSDAYRNGLHIERDALREEPEERSGERNAKHKCLA